jgi:anthranilate synthase component II
MRKGRAGIHTVFLAFYTTHRHNKSMLTLIDNYDSFTYNLVQYLGDLGEKVQVYRNDERKIEHILEEKPHRIVISPGPSDPDHAGICLDLIKAAGEKGIPLLGVCLGHQAITQAFGGQVVRAPIPLHGKTSMITHNGKGLFAAIPSPYSVTRYHSLMSEIISFPDCLEATAHTQDGLIMALAHKTKPIFGVQFHPESIATEYGYELLRNFLKIA